MANSPQQGVPWDLAHAKWAAKEAANNPDPEIRAAAKGGLLAYLKLPAEDLKERQSLRRQRSFHAWAPTVGITAAVCLCVWLLVTRRITIKQATVTALATAAVKVASKTLAEKFTGLFEPSSK